MPHYVDAYICRIQRSPAPILEPTLKLGGSPVFLSETSWPTCAHCGCQMDFLAQVPLQNPISFSSMYQMAYVFMCPGQFDDRGWLTCETYRADSGANAVLLQKSSGRTLPWDSASEYPDYSVTLERTSEAAIDTSDYTIPDQLSDTVYQSTKLGGVPLWLQDNETPSCPVCHGPMKFIAQIDAELDGSLPADPSKWDDEKYKFFMFGDSGIGYLFLCDNECTPTSAAFLWQTT